MIRALGPAPLLLPRLSRVAVCALLSAFTGPVDPALHKGPPVWVECEISESQVEIRFTGEQPTLNHWLGFADTAAPFAAPMSEADVEQVTAAVRRVIVGRNELTIDGEAPEFAILEVGVPGDEVTGYGLPALTFTLRASRAESPRRIGIVWTLWERLEWFEQVRLPIVFRAFGDAQLAFVSPEEPGYVWHPESVVPRETPEVVELSEPPPRRLTVPLLAAALGVASLALLAFGFRSRAHRGAFLTAGLLAIGGAALARDVAHVEIDNPLRPSVTVPDAERAAALFERLQRNVYAAFEARSEQEIYDLLAVSVVPDLLDELYGQIYESLILRGQGGAICQIERIEVLSSDVDPSPEIEPWEFVALPDDDAPFFRVEQEWKVHGVVVHWGHEHRRTNHYRARYTVAHDGRSWKIAGVEILDHTQVDSDG